MLSSAQPVQGGQDSSTEGPDDKTINSEHTSR